MYALIFLTEITDEKKVFGWGRMDYGQLGQTTRQHGVSSDHDTPMSKSQQDVKLWCHIPMEIERLGQVKQVLAKPYLGGDQILFVFQISCGSEHTIAVTCKYIV